MNHLSTYSQHLRTPEHELLILCARTRLTSVEADRLAELVRMDIDWGGVVELAHRHRLGPMLYNHLRMVCRDDVPASTFRQLQSHAETTAIGSMVRIAELVRLVRLFEAHGIRSQVIKGPVLGASVYQNVALRPFGDIDVVVDRENLLRCKQLLLEEGYAPRLEMTEAEEESFLDEQFGYNFICQKNGVPVDIELHWALTHKSFPFPISGDALWKSTQPVQLGGATLHTLPVEELLLFLCVHGAKHEWHQLILVCDVAEFLRSAKGLDWNRLLECARAARTERILYLGLYLASKLFDAPVPGPVLREAQQTGAVPILADQVVDWAFRENEQPRSRRDVVRFHMRVREDVRDTLRLRAENLMLLFKPSEKDRSFVAIPEAFAFLYVLIRPLRVLLESKGKLTRSLL